MILNIMYKIVYTL